MKIFLRVLFGERIAQVASTGRLSLVAMLFTAEILHFVATEAAHGCQGTVGEVSTDFLCLESMRRPGV